MRHKPAKKPHRADDAPLTRKELATARPLRTIFTDLARVGRRRAKKGEPTKVPVSLRLSPDVIAHFKATGAGWQTRLDDALRLLIGSP